MIPLEMPGQSAGTSRPPRTSQLRSGESRSSRSTSSFDEDGNGRPAHSHGLGDDLTYARSPSRYSSTGDSIAQGSKEQQNGRGSFRRHRPKSSGGFLLESAFESVQGQGADKKSTQNGQTSTFDVKSGIASKIGQWRKRRNTRPKSKGGSTSSEPPATPPSLVKSSPRSPSSVTSSPPPRNGLIASEENNVSSQNTTTGALGPDPLQIVNLALNLSENRQKSSGRIIRTPPENLVASQSTRSHRSGASGGSLKQYLDGQRYASTSPRSASGVKHSQRLASAEAPSAPELGTHLINSFGTLQDAPFLPSQATLARAERARVALELAFQYRRLLSLLPPLRLPPSRPISRRRLSTSSSPTSHTALSKSSSKANSVEEPGRVYNPLQCIRNRLVRARTRKPLDIEARSWANVGAVSAWIDEVERESGASGQTGLLPTYAPANDGMVQNGGPSPESSTRRPANKRQKMDWATEYSEFLADAYWLEQDNNKSLIEDPEGNKIYPFSGERTSGSFGNTFEKLNLPAASKANQSPEKALPEQASDHRRISTEDVKPRNSHRRLPSTQAEPALSFSADQAKPTKPLSSSSSRSGSLSMKLSDPRIIQPKDSKTPDARASLDDRALANRMIQLLENDRKGSNGNLSDGPRHGSYVFPHREEDNELGSSRESTTRRKPSKDSGKEDSAHSSLRRFGSTLPHFKRTSISSDIFKRSRVSTDELDLTAPSSPDPSSEPRKSKPVFGDLVPSISLNLSAPSSRDVSPTRKPRPLPLGPAFEPNSIDRHEEGGDISETDFAAEGKSRYSKEMSRQSSVSQHLTRDSDTNPIVSQIPSIRADDKKAKGHKRSDSRWKRGEKEEKDIEPAKKRGIFKGGRIEEIVKSEVSRVGDFIWKKEPPPVASARSSPASSRASNASDSDDEAVYDTTQEELSRSPTRTKTEESVTGISRVRSHLPHFHSFRSTFGSTLSETKTTETLDPVTKQQTITPRPVTPPPKILGQPDAPLQNSPPAIDSTLKIPNRRRSAAPRIEKRKSSYAASDKRPEPDRPRPPSVPRDSDPIFPELSRQDSLFAPVNSLRSTGALRLPITGLAALDASEHRRDSLDARTSPQRHFSVSDRPEYDAHTAASRREIARVKAQLICSGVKAMEIQRLYAQKRPMREIQLRNRLASPLPAVPRAQEEQYAARLIEHDIDLSIQQFDNTAAHLRNVTISDLFDRIKAVQDEFNSKLLPMARASGDDADTFNTGLASTHTLAIKQLNDSVYTMARRRRRRLKWVRRFGFVLLEWIVLGLMWWVWLLFVIIRLIRGTGRAAISFVRWLFWL